MPLGVLPKNENLGDDMVDIMLHLHQYVPLVQTTRQVFVPGIEEEVEVCQASLHRILLGGDQLTAARARAAIKTRVNSLSCGTRLDGLIPCAEDWHTKVNLLDVSHYKHLLPQLLCIVFYVYRSFGSTTIQCFQELIMVHCIN